jgi:hypothetical protein
MIEQLEKKGWFVPPGLRRKINLFLAHLDAAKGKPVMIVGDTGVGKSMFLDVAKLHYSQQLSIQKTEFKQKIVEANCAHFGRAGSDANIARAEIFGCSEDIAHSLRLEPKQGLLSQADNGLLILEEIGELALDVQAMLLTFIETNEYRMLGGIEPVPSNIQIISATNNTADLREDFKFRFLRFSIPPIYLRRDDILHYLLKNYPDALDELYTWEIFCLLTHNWPGNVREINYIGFLLDRQIRLRLQKDFKPRYNIRVGSFQDSLLFGIVDEGRNDLGIDLNKIIDFELDFYVHGKKVLHDLYRKLPMLELSHRFFFKDSIPKKFGFDANGNKYSDDMKTQKISRINFELSCFGEFFNVNVNTPRNMLDDVDKIGIFNETSVDRYLQLKDKEVFEMFHSSKPSYVRIADYFHLIFNLNKTTSESENLNIKQNIWYLSEEELLAAYHKGLLMLCGCNVVKAAKKLKISPKALYMRIDKYEIDIEYLRNMFCSHKDYKSDES